MRLGSLLFWPVWQEERSVPPEQLQVEKRKQNKCKIDAHQSSVTVITSRAFISIPGPLEYVDTTSTLTPNP